MRGGLDFLGFRADSKVMADTTQNLSHHPKKGPAKKRSPYIGVTKEGIKILRPRGRVDNVTLAQARKAVATVRAERQVTQDQSPSKREN